MTPIPDLAGFRDAQDRLRQQFGQDVTFTIPQAKTYASDVALDPETGEPYDPTAVPEDGAEDDTATITVNVIFKPLSAGGPDDVIRNAAIGVMRSEGIALIASVGDYDDIAEATGFEVNGIKYGVTDIVPDGLATLHRYIVFGEPK